MISISLQFRLCVSVSANTSTRNSIKHFISSSMMTSQLPSNLPHSFFKSSPTAPKQSMNPTHQTFFRELGLSSRTSLTKLSPIQYSSVKSRRTVFPDNARLSRDKNRKSRVVRHFPRSLIVSHHSFKRANHSSDKRSGIKNKKFRQLRSRGPYKFNEILTDKNKETLSMMVSKIRALKNIRNNDKVIKSNQSTQIMAQIALPKSQRSVRILRVKRLRHEIKNRHLSQLASNSLLKRPSIII